MTPDVGHYDIKVRRGRVFRLKFTYKPGGVEADLTGYKAKMMVKTAAGDSAAWPGFDLSTENGAITIVGAHVEARVDWEVTQALSDFSRSGVYDIVLIPPIGDPKAALEGSVQVVDSVTTL